MGGSAVASITGTYEHNMDAKGRLAVPAKLRDELGTTFYLTMGLDRCLSIYPQESWAVFTEKFDSLPITQSKKMRALFANTLKCELDAQGRILIPQNLRDWAGLQKEVVIIGVNSRAEIWDAERWHAEQAELTPEALGAMFEEWSV